MPVWILQNLKDVVYIASFKLNIVQFTNMHTNNQKTGADFVISEEKNNSSRLAQICHWIMRYPLNKEY